MDTSAHADPPEPGRVPTWRDGVVLTAQEKAQLSPEQLRRFLDESVVRDLSEIESMPEPMRTRVLAMVGRARERVLERIAVEEGRQAS